MVKIMKIGSGCTLKEICNLDREIAQAKSNHTGINFEPKGSCHFSFGNTVHSDQNLKIIKGNL